MRRLRTPLVLVVLLGLAVAGGLHLASGSGLSVTTQKLSAFRSCVLTGYPGTSAAVSDTYADELFASSPNGTASDIDVRSQNLNRNQRGFIRFDLSHCSPAIPATATVKQATLRLYARNVPSSARNYEAHRVTTPCPETPAVATCWSEGSLTWSNQPGVAASPTATTSICSAASCNNLHYDWLVSADVAVFVAGSVPNYGWRVADSAESGAILGTLQAQFRSTEHNAADTGPELVVVYSP